jgi:hypothetical protein
MKKMLLSAALTAATLTGFSQSQGSNANGTPIVDGSANSISRFDLRYEGQRGTPYFIPQWIKGEMEFADGRMFKDTPLKYNSYSKELMMIRPGGDSLIIYPYQVKNFAITDATSTFQFKRFPNVSTTEKNISRDTYFLVLYEGKTSLLKLVSKTIRKADFKDPYSNGIRYDKFEDNNSYYILKADNSLSKVKMNKKSLLSTLEDKQGLPDFLKRENIEIRNESEMVNVVKQYDSI